MRSIFSITGIADLKFLSELYDNVRGELDVKQGDKPLFSIEWMMNPFKALLNSSKLPNYPFNVLVRLVGPDTIKAVACQIEKMNVASFEHPKKNLILEWADHIDAKVGSEMDRTNDMGYLFIPPKQNLTNMSELLLAINLSKYATHVIPLNLGFIVTNLKSRYLSCVGLTSKLSCTTSLMFDKDDGFISPFDSEADSIQYLNTRFELWKNSGYHRKMTDYYENF